MHGNDSCVELITYPAWLEISNGIQNIANEEQCAHYIACYWKIVGYWMLFCIHNEKTFTLRCMSFNPSKWNYLHCNHLIAVALAVWWWCCYRHNNCITYRIFNRIEIALLLQLIWNDCKDLTLSVNSFLETHFDQSELINKIRLFFCKMHFEYDLFKIKCRP